ncbi:MAG: hypothetical protein OES84_01810 [Kiritimatiellaceae bacterium]|nr:hypothetical protein [Kiritimatiellaceae bacterium]
MIAVFNTSSLCDWAKLMGDTPWPLLPVANRPLLDYWLETCGHLGIETVHLVLGEDAKQIEDFAGSGKRWNLTIQYTFARPSERMVDYLKSISNHWQNGLFYIGGPFFMRRRQDFISAGFQALEACRHDFEGEPLFLYGTSATEVKDLLEGTSGESCGLEQVHVHPLVIGGIEAYYALNMKMASGECSRYVTAGFSGSDGSSIGYNVQTPPSSHLQPPILVGDDCHFGAMTTIGPHAVVAKHVIVDSYSELTECLILADTYIGRNLEIRKKIVSGNRLIDPFDGTVVEIDDSWLVARNRPEMRSEDFMRYVILWFVALALALIQVVPYLIFSPLILVTKIAGFTRVQFHDPRTGYITLPVFHKRSNRKSMIYRLFIGLSLDRFPLVLQVLRGKIFLCGQPPMQHPQDDGIIKQLPRYYPGVFCYRDYNRDSDMLVDALWYAHARSLFEDIKILIKAVVSRFISAGRQ